MVQYAEPIERLIQAFSRLPGIGEKSATRLALFILNSKSGYVEELVDSLDTLKEKVKLCGTCMAFSATDPCPTCSDPARNHALICVVSERLASGVPVGSYVEYMDGVTLGRAMDGRRLV
jgi:recombination protein RecR